MATGLTSRLSILYPLGTDSASIATDMQNIAQFCDTNFIPYTQSAATTPPVTTISGSFWWCTNSAVSWYGLNYYNGSAWVNLGVDPVYYGSTTPATPYTSMLWVNTNTTTPALQVYNGTSWINLLPGTNTSGLIPISSGSGWTLSTLTDTTKVPLTSFSPAYKNLLLNGAMDINQRLGSLYNATGSQVCGLDRWVIYCVGVSQQNVSQVTSGLTGLPYAQRCQRLSGSALTSPQYVAQSLEIIDCSMLQGQTVVLSFYARAGATFISSSQSLNVQLVSGTGTVDNGVLSGYTGAVTLISATPTLTSGWVRYSYSATIPTNATQFGVLFENTPTGTAGASEYFDITGVQLELGSSPTVFTRQGGNYSEELRFCQRYYQRINGNTDITAVGTAVGTSISTARAQINLACVMRTKPSIGYRNGGLIIYNGTVVDAIYTIGGVYADPINPFTVMLDLNSGSNLTVGNAYTLYISQISGIGYVDFTADI